MVGVGPGIPGICLNIGLRKPFIPTTVDSLRCYLYSIGFETLLNQDLLNIFWTTRYGNFREIVIQHRSLRSREADVSSTVVRLCLQVS